MVVGLSENCRILAVPPTVTMTGADTELLSAPNAVSVYVVVWAGETTRLPLTGRLSPTPLMLTRVAFDVVQDRVDDSPCRILVGVASNLKMLGFDTDAATVTVTVAR